MKEILSDGNDCPFKIRHASAKNDTFKKYFWLTPYTATLHINQSVGIEKFKKLIFLMETNLYHNHQKRMDWM